MWEAAKQRVSTGIHAATTLMGSFSFGVRQEYRITLELLEKISKSDEILEYPA